MARMVVRSLAFILGWMCFEASASSAGESNPTGSGFSINLNAEIPETINAIVTAVEHLVEGAKKQSYLTQLEGVREIVAELAGEEIYVAAQLRHALELAKQPPATPGLREQQDQASKAVNESLRQARITFRRLKSALSGLQMMPGVEAKAIGGLSCVESDSVLFGYADCSVDSGQALSVKGATELFGAGRVDRENAKAERLLASIVRESNYLFEIAEALQKASDKWQTPSVKPAS